MVLWKEDFIDRGEHTRSGQALGPVGWIVWHYTADPGATDENERDYFNSQSHDPNARYASAHMFIDKDSATLTIPLNELAYHAGNRTYNQHSIGIELCIERDGTFHPNTLSQAVKIGAFLCKKYELNALTKNIRHFDVTGKICPKPWVDHPELFTAFKSQVASAMKGEYKMSPADANKMIDTWLKPAYGAAKTAAERKEVARLADEVRKSAGLPVQNS